MEPNPTGPPRFVPPPPTGPPRYVGPPQTAPRTCGLAVASMVLGILWIYWIGSLLAIIFGHVALGRIDRSNGVLLGRGMAIAGLVLGYIGAATAVLTGLALAGGN